MKNSYPDKPIVPYKKTSVSMNEVINYIINLPIQTEVKRATYIFFRNESENGTRGINNNYAGIQADSGRWNKKFDESISGTVELKENGTGRLRRFLAFRDFRASIDFLSDRVKDRGLYVGGFAHLIAKIIVADRQTLARVYQKEWVKGDPAAEPTPEQLKNFLSMYHQSELFFPIQ
jgi:hypothetical protein